MKGNLKNEGEKQQRGDDWEITALMQYKKVPAEAGTDTPITGRARTRTSPEDKGKT